MAGGEAATDVARDEDIGTARMRDDPAWFIVIERSTVKRLLAHLRAIVNRPRVMHYLDIFVAAFVVDLVANQQHILGAHGLDALKALIVAAAVAGGKAMFEAYRKGAGA